jgi:hypothetical protein
MGFTFLGLGLLFLFSAQLVSGEFQIWSKTALAEAFLQKYYLVQYNLIVAFFCRPIVFGLWLIYVQYCATQ